MGKQGHVVPDSIVVHLATDRRQYLILGDLPQTTPADIFSKLHFAGSEYSGPVMATDQ